MNILNTGAFGFFSYHPGMAKDPFKQACHPEGVPIVTGTTKPARVPQADGDPSAETSRCFSRLLGVSMTTEKKLYILRPCMIHGPGSKENGQSVYF